MRWQRIEAMRWGERDGMRNKRYIDVCANDFPLIDIPFNSRSLSFVRIMNASKYVIPFRVIWTALFKTDSAAFQQWWRPMLLLQQIIHYLRLGLFFCWCCYCCILNIINIYTTMRNTNMSATFPTDRQNKTATPWAQRRKRERQRMHREMQASKQHCTIHQHQHFTFGIRTAERGLWMANAQSKKDRCNEVCGRSQAQKLIIYKRTTILNLMQSL